MTAPVIVWFRRDLRLSDNPALHAAAQVGRPVIALFVLDETEGLRPTGAAGRWWLDKSLAALAADLAARGVQLVLRRGPAADVVPSLATETGAAAVYWNRLYDPGTVERDTALKASFRAAGIEAHSFKASLLVEPWEVRTRSGSPFQVFTAFWRAARGQVRIGDALSAPESLPCPNPSPPSDRLQDWRLHPYGPDWSGGFDEWTPGERGGLARLHDFVDDGLAGYAQARDRPDLPGSSRLSPHLHWGEVGPAQVWRATQSAVARGAASEADADSFLGEIGWREFNHHLLFHRPDLPLTDFKPTLNGLAWRTAPKDLSAWRRGRTGFPLVDAGMRQLWTTGWMHNRVRMVVASFLVKDLLIDWREGERWFWDTLVDADEANNAAGWQWTAGSGADAAPFFRIFNPVRQGERFDPEGDYVRRWVPELAKLPAGHIHAPWLAPPERLAAAKVVLGETYPRPLVDHAAARERALTALKRAASHRSVAPSAVAS